MSKGNCVVVIPIHNPDPTPYELVSFRQCFNILGNHPIKIIAPEGLLLDNYRSVVATFDAIFINPKWQSSLIGYNRLKKSRFFYSLFDGYEFLLTYELDAFVFSDELEYWCNQGYDYIGAPWFEGLSQPAENAKITGAGNSGFSLRKIKPIQQILKSMHGRNPLDTNNSLKHLLKLAIKMPLGWIMSIAGENYTVLNNYDLYEDGFFALAVPLVFRGFKVAPPKVAMRFSFEVNPEYLFELNNRALPMGCHAWQRYNLSFWKPFIEEFGYRL